MIKDQFYSFFENWLTRIFDSVMKVEGGGGHHVIHVYESRGDPLSSSQMRGD